MVREERTARCGQGGHPRVEVRVVFEARATKTPFGPVGSTTRPNIIALGAGFEPATPGSEDQCSIH